MTYQSSLNVLVTGATRGLGLHTARSLARAGAHVLVAGRDRSSIKRIADEIGGEPVLLDLSDLDSVRTAADELTQRVGADSVDVVIANAAVQIPGAVTTTRDGWETTFQVNHLGHLLLVDRLFMQARLPRRVVFVGSASHDPARTTLPDPSSGDVDVVATGNLTTESGTGDQGMRRYATSKLLVTATALGLARDHPTTEIWCYDPGAMLTTGLYRKQRLGQRILFAIAGRLSPRRPGFSTPNQSGEGLAKLALDGTVVPPNHTVNADGTTTSVSPLAASEAYQDRVLDQSRALMAKGISAA